LRKQVKILQKIAAKELKKQFLAKRKDAEEELRK